MNFRHNLLLSTALLTAMTAPTLAQKDAPVKLTLSQVKPSELFEMLVDTGEPNLLPDGITMLTPDDTGRYLLVQGNTEGINRLREIIRLMDVQQKTLRLEARILLQKPVKGSASPSQEVVGTTTLSLINNRRGQAILVGQGHVFHVQVTPHINGDGTTTLHVRFTKAQTAASATGKSLRQDSLIETTRRMSDSEIKILAGLSVGGDQPPYVAPLSKDNPTPDSPFRVTSPMFLLEVKPLVTPQNGKEGSGRVVATPHKRTGQAVK